MESTPIQLAKLNEEEIIKNINELQCLCYEIFNIQEEFSHKYQQINNVVEILRMHFIPESIVQKTVPRLDLKEIIEQKKFEPEQTENGMEQTP